MAQLRQVTTTNRPSSSNALLFTLVLLLIVRTNFSEFRDDWHKLVRAKTMYYAHTRNFFNEVLEKMLNLVRGKS